MYLGIDAGGTHTDAVLVHEGRICAHAKVRTTADTMTVCLKNVLEQLQQKVAADMFSHLTRVTMGSTLGLNALVQKKLAPVGVFLTAGPGMDAHEFGIGSHVFVLPSARAGLDHRGSEVTQLTEESLEAVVEQARIWHNEGIENFAVVGKFSPRNTVHETMIAKKIAPYGHVTMGHSLSGQLNFPRRIATAYANAAVRQMQEQFLYGIQTTLHELGITAPLYILKSDGGAMPFKHALRYPLFSLLSGPAASVMGLLAIQNEILVADKHKAGCDHMLLDMGGTTTDIAIYAAKDGGHVVPILDAHGMRVALHGKEYKTHVRALATHSVGIGGDSLLRIDGQGHKARILVGPERLGPAMAFGGQHPTLLDAANVFAVQQQRKDCICAGQVGASVQGLQKMALAHNVDMGFLAECALQEAFMTIMQGIQALLNRFVGQPVYTLAELLQEYSLNIQVAWLVGGPAKMLHPCLLFVQQKICEMREKHETTVSALQKISLCTPTIQDDYLPAVNAIGAALTLPTAEKELFADTLEGVWYMGDEQGSALPNFSVQDAARLVQNALKDEQDHSVQQAIDVVESQSFATLDSYGRSGKDIRVRCQCRPGIVAVLQEGV